MTRLIDANELHEILNWTMFKPPFSKKQVRRFIDDSRTVDAIPVIRCKDCKYFYKEERYCVLGTVAISDGYCYLGERKEE